MATIVNRPKGHKWIQFKGLSGKRQTLRLGEASDRQASDMRQLVERILSQQATGNALDTRTLQWIGTLSPKMHQRMAALGLIEGIAATTIGDLIGEFKKSLAVKEST